MMCAKFGIIVIANNDLAMGGGRDLWITLYSETPLPRHSVLSKMQDYANIEKARSCSFFIFVRITSL